MTDTVFVSNLCIHGMHGVFPEENRLGQKFYVDIECQTDFGPCTEADDYRKAVCYGTLCDLAAEVSEAGPYKLIETFAERIAHAVLARFPTVAQVRVQIRKPSAPLRAVLDHAGVEVTRPRRLRIAFSLGSNLGDKVAHIRSALALLQAEEGIEIDKVSHFYRTAPWGNEDQDWFVNACAIGWTTRPPLSVLKACKRIEVQVGRVPGVRWGPRAIDVDLLFADDLVIETPALTLPHPEMFNRAFVLLPLAEVAPDHEVLGRRIQDEAGRMTVEPGDVVMMEP